MNQHKLRLLDKAKHYRVVALLHDIVNTCSCCLQLTKTSSVNCRFLPITQQDGKYRKATHNSRSCTISDSNK